MREQLSLDPLEQRCLIGEYPAVIGGQQPEKLAAVADLEVAIFAL